MCPFRGASLLRLCPLFFLFFLCLVCFRVFSDPPPILSRSHLPSQRTHPEDRPAQRSTKDNDHLGGSKLNSWDCADVGLLCHLPEFHFGRRSLRTKQFTHIHMLHDLNKYKHRVHPEPPGFGNEPEDSLKGNQVGDCFFEGSFHFSFPAEQQGCLLFPFQGTCGFIPTHSLLSSGK